MNMNVPPSAASLDSEEDSSDDDSSGKSESKISRVFKAKGNSKWAPIAVLGAGPAGLTCATYLSRLGYRSITLYESGKYAGGLRYVPFQSS